MNPQTLHTLAWTPFLQPLNLHAHWLWLLPPLVFAIALTYKALKAPTPDRLLSSALRLSAYILVLVVLAAALLWGLVAVV